MEKERKIKIVVKKVTFAEAENADDEYWAQASPEERLQEVFKLRKMVYGDLINQPIKKIVRKGNVHDIEN